MLDFFGRLHLLLLHLPIGLLGFSFLFELLGRFRGRSDWSSAACLLLGWGAVTATLSAACGWLLAQQGGYDEALLFKHQWFGFGTAALALGAGQRNSRAYFPLLATCALSLVATGHLGGSLTHGENYLFETAAAKNAKEEAKPAISPESIVFSGCYSAHFENEMPIVPSSLEEKRRPGPEYAGGYFKRREKRRGGSARPSRREPAPQTPAAAPAPRRPHLPSGKPQLSPGEAALLRWWIEQGADFQKTVAQMPMPSEVETALFAKNNTPHNPGFLFSPFPAAASDLAKLRAAGASVAPLGVENPWLSVSFAGNGKLNETMLAALRPLAEQVVDLDLSNTSLDDAMFEKMPALPHLTRLHLAQTALSDATLAKSAACI